ncbi:MAG: hypothetical protein HYZ29_03115 [Myxococcales bacterium]|nr:hypothetical protein [Myxococcales bacterium]
MNRFGIGAGVMLGALTLSGLAQADVQSATRTADGDRYIFDDELLSSGANFPSAARIRVRPIRGRVLLIRPRASFVREMFKSVEKM